MTLSRSIAFLTPEEVRNWETQLFIGLIEIFFLIQFVLRFITEFPDPDTELPVDTLKGIITY